MSIKRMLLVVMVSAAMLGTVSLISHTARAASSLKLPAAPPDFTVTSVKRDPAPTARVVQSTRVVTVPASADATIDSRYPDTNYGNNTAFVVSFNPTGTVYSRSTLIYFDLSTALPLDAILDQAHLELHQYVATGANPVSISATHVITAWNEISVTWATQPARGTISVAASVDSATGYKSWDVTSVVSAWLTGNNYGLLLTHLPGQEESLDHRFSSRENAQYNPRLVISYHRPSDFCGGTFDAIQDTYVRSDQPTYNYGEPGYIELKRDAGGSPEARVYLKFDSAQLAAAIPPDSNIYNAVLELYLTQTPTPTAYAFEVWGVSGAWNEYLLTWNTQPTLTIGFGSTLYNVSYTGVPTSVVRVDATSLATLWATKAVTQTDVALLPATAGMDVFFAASGVSRASTLIPSFASPRSRLIVHCTPPVPPNSHPADGLDSRIVAGLQRLQAASSITPTIELERGAVRFANFALDIPVGMSSDGRVRAQWFTQAYSDLLSLNDPYTDLQMVGRSADNQHIVFRQRYQGIPVYPAQLVVNMRGNQVNGLSGAYLTEINVDPRPQLSAEHAEDLALAQERMKTPVSQTLAIQSVQAYEFYQPRVAGQTQLRYLNLGLIGGLGRNSINPQPEPPGISSDPTTYLVWQVNLHNGLVYYIDAHSGAVRFMGTHRMSDFDLDIDTGNHSGPSDTCWFWDATWDNDNYCDEDGCNGGDQEGNEAYNASRDIYHWWNGYFNWDSYDTAGTEIDMYIHVGSNWNNAHWLGDCGYFEFGDGYGYARDVVGHEYTHAVQDNLPNGGLVYESQPGALNESFADIFGVITEMYHNDSSGGYYDPIDWLFGEDAPGDVRDLSDPTQSVPPQPDRYVDPFVPLSDDHGGVHYYSGINNKAAYLMISGSSFNGYDMPVAIGWQRTAVLLYHVLHRIPATAGFVEVQQHAVQTAIDFSDLGMYEFGAQEICTVRNAYAAVGLGYGDHECDGIVDDTDPEILDSDGIPDAWDNCPSINNATQVNHDTDTLGDACDSDNDNDGVLDGPDNCNNTWNLPQFDGNNDGQGDACDDSDGDTRVDAYDNCRTVANPDWSDWDGDGLGDACDPDDDNDGVLDSLDNCPYIPNASQTNTDGDAFGNVCDKCMFVANNDVLENVDPDHDGLGNICDADDDGDDVLDDGDSSGSPVDKPCGNTLKMNCDDNCRLNRNPTQSDWNDDGAGDACDDSRPDVADNVHHEVLIRDGEKLHHALTNPPPYDEGSANAYLPVGYKRMVEVKFQAGLDARFSAKIIDSEGHVLARAVTTLEGGQYKVNLRFTPKTYAVNAMMSPATCIAGPSAAQSLAPDEVQYHLELAPLPGTPVNQVYSYTVTTIGYSARIYLPLALK